MQHGAFKVPHAEIHPSPVNVLSSPHCLSAIIEKVNFRNQPLFGRKNLCKYDRKYGFKERYIYAIIGKINYIVTHEKG